MCLRVARVLIAAPPSVVGCGLLAMVRALGAKAGYRSGAVRCRPVLPQKTCDGARAVRAATGGANVAQAGRHDSHAGRSTLRGMGASHTVLGHPPSHSYPAAQRRRADACLSPYLWNSRLLLYLSHPSLSL